MSLVIADRVQETTTTTGTGTITLAGAVTGYQAFSAIGNGNTTYYTITDGTNWEVGIGTYTLSGTTLARTTVLASSNAGALVNFPAGTKTVFCTLPAAKAITTDQVRPAFSAYAGAGTSATTNVTTKVAFNTVEYDTNSCYDATTNFRFTPNVAGKYQINALIESSTACAYSMIYIYKNGSPYKGGNGYTVGGQTYFVGASALIDCNGTTDFIEIYWYQNAGTTGSTYPGQVATYFQGFLARAN